MKLWQIAALIVCGLAFGAIRPGFVGNFFHFATFYVFLPAIIFEAAWQLDLKTMRAGWKPIVLLAVPGVIITAAIIAASVHLGAGLPLTTSLILGAVLSATDPVAVTSIFRKLPVPEMLSTIVESESLLNDAIAVVLFGIVLAIGTVPVPTADTVVGESLKGLFGSLVGLLAGSVCGYVGSFALRRGVPLLIQGLITFATAYAAYFITQGVGGSGIFATIACALTMRELERSYVSVDMAKAVEHAWTIAANGANAVLFFLVGAAVQLSALAGLRAVLIATVAGVLVSRFILAYGLLQLAPRMKSAWMTVVRLAGVRGAVSLALALSLSTAIPQQRAIVAATFAVVIVTLLIGSLTFMGRIRRLDLG
ncbi:MAG TPA: cation:proton antiporter [Candidatus Aquilonibacter sp.]|nr:cation:proton antiporter [Candidatus Aquilonibacter sp.]